MTHLRIRVALASVIFLGGCSSFNRNMNHILFVGVGTQLKAYRFIPAQGTLTEMSGSPVSVGGTVTTVSSDLSATTIFVGESTTFKIKSYSIDAKALSVTAKSSTTYVDSPGGLCFTSTGGAIVFAKSGTLTDVYHGAYVNSAGALVVGVGLGGQAFELESGALL